jgi:hypothetical protein
MRLCSARLDGELVRPHSKPACLQAANKGPSAKHPTATFCTRPNATQKLAIRKSLIHKASGNRYR